MDHAFEAGERETRGVGGDNWEAGEQKTTKKTQLNNENKKW